MPQRALGIVCCLVSVSAITSSFQTAPPAGKQGIIPVVLQVMEVSPPPPPRLTTPSDQLVGEVAETVKPIGVSRWQSFSYYYH